MLRKTLIIILLLFSISLIIYLLMPSDKKRIKNLIRAGKEAAIQKDLSGVMGQVSYNYKDRYGFTYLYLKETLKRLFNRYDTFEIEIKRLRVDLEDGRGEARFLLKAAGIKGDRSVYILGTEEVYESVFLTLEKERIKWQVVETYFPTREGIVF